MNFFFTKERASCEAVTTSHEVTRRERKSSGYLALESRFHADDRVMICPAGTDWLIFLQNMQINLIGLFDCNYQRDVADISHLIYFGKFCPSPPGKKIVCRINKTARGDSLLTVSRLSVAALQLALSFVKKSSKKNVGTRVSLINSSEEIVIEKCS